MTKIRILLADDHAVLRAGLKALLATQPDLEPVGEAGDGAEAVRLAARLRPDVLLLDVTMPGNEHLAALRAVRDRAPTVRTLLLTMHENETMLREALRLGAAGYVLKKAAEAELLTAIRAVARGEAYIDPGMTRAMIEGYLGTAESRSTRGMEEVQTDGLTAREIEVLKLTAEGYTNKEVAEKLVVSVKTVETHKAHIAEKLGMKSRVEWLRYARQKGLLSPTSGENP
ncbi:MAG: DNA-binding response regulator [Anaerolineae bacterium]|nr:response regulator transcription factor [Anaerolineales bacterium]MCQ3976078.1 DNA-binding response regulator [Anaerolineae bacterium]